MMKPTMNRKEGNQTITYDVYVGNVPKNINEIDLQQLFNNYGEVKQVLCRWKEDYFGYGIVKFLFKKDADRILREVQEVTWNGHTMPVKTARRSEHSNQNGNSNVELMKPSVYSDMNKNQICSGSNFSNTDYGHFQYIPPPMANEQVIRSQSGQSIKLDVLCTSVEDPITFYGYPVNRSEDLMMITSSLNNLNYNHNPLVKKPVQKKVYAALFSEDNSWYRCSVIKSSLPNKPGMCSVRYIDFGNQEEICYQNIIEIPESLQKIHPIASKFVFSHLVCDTKATNKRSCLHQLVNKRMTLSARLSPNLEYQVFWCSCNGKDVISDIVSKGFARPVRRDSNNQELNGKTGAYACGGEIKMHPNHSHVSSLYTPKSHESPVVNGTNNKKIPKSQCKSKEGSPKNEELFSNGTVDEIKKDDDFHPKRIIKRGSELGDGPTKSSLETTPKENNSTQPTVYTLDSVHPNLKFINNIRSLVSQSSDDSFINYAVDLLKNEISTIVHSEASIKNVALASQKYWEAVENIKMLINEKMANKSADMTVQFSFEEKLSSLKSTRDSMRVDLFNKLKDYLESCDSSIFQRKEKIQKIIMDLESNSNAWMNVQLPKKPDTVDELILEYNKVKEERWNLVSKTRAKTDHAHCQFDNMLSTIKKEFHLNTLKENEVSDLSSNDCNIGRKPSSYDDQLQKALNVFGNALEEEIQTLTVNKDSGNYSVIQCLLDILDVHKEKIDALCDHYENHYAIYNDLNKLPDIEKTLKDFKSASEEVHALSEELFFKEGSIGDVLEKEMSALRRKLHGALLKEDSLKGILAKATESHFPELYFEAFELNLLNYLENKLLLKVWRPGYFLNFGSGQRGESSYLSYLHDEPVTIKEYSFGTEEECNTFIRKAIHWNEVRSEHLVKIKALFYKDSKTVCVLLPPVLHTLLQKLPSTSPCENEKACRILRQVLIGLKDIHSAGLVHHAIHPTVIVIENEKALIDFCFDPTFLDGRVSLKDINFSPPENKASHASADMYGFGCLVLWVLFPNLSLTPTEDGTPNIDAFRSIIQELILPKDYSYLSTLIDANPERRPSSCTLLSKGFLSKYEAFCRSRCETQKSASL